MLLPSLSVTSSRKCTRAENDLAWLDMLTSADSFVNVLQSYGIMLLVMKFACSKVASDCAHDRPLLTKLEHQNERQSSSSTRLKHNRCERAPRLQEATCRITHGSAQKSLRMRKSFDFEDIKWCHSNK